MRLTVLVICVALLVACGSDSGAEPRVEATATVTPPPSATGEPVAQPAQAEPTEVARAATATATQSPPTPTQPPPTATQPPATAAAPPTQAPPTATPAPVASPVSLTVSAQALSFDRELIVVPAHAQVTVTFENNDTSIDHDFGVSIPQVPHTATCAGPCSASISFDSGPPATYTFQCSIHAEMVGTFRVE